LRLTAKSERMCIYGGAFMMMPVSEKVADIFVIAAGAITLVVCALQALKDQGVILQDKPKRPFRLFAIAAAAMQGEKAPSSIKQTSPKKNPHP